MMQNKYNFLGKQVKYISSMIICAFCCLNLKCLNHKGGRHSSSFELNFVNFLKIKIQNGSKHPHGQENHF